MTKIQLAKAEINASISMIYEIIDGNEKDYPIYIINHIYRIFLQVSDTKQIESLMGIVLDRQLENGGWGVYKYSQNSVYGITATEIQLLLWTMEIVCKDKDSIKDAIARGIIFLLDHCSEEGYWKEQYETERVHGILDINHYILQALCYSDLHTDLNILGVRDAKKRLMQFYVNRQEKDGGWHEEGKVRTRVGATSDAVRALLPCMEMKSYVKMGIYFLINNQNPYMGYWVGGNHDKCYDSLKAIINATYLICEEDFLVAINKGIDFILSFKKSSMNLEELCDHTSVLIDYVMKTKYPHRKKTFF